MMVPREINFVASSDPAAGAINRSADGSAFEVQLQDAIKVPREAVNVTLAVENASIWWTIPNIITGVNDKMHVVVPNVADVLTPYTITIDQGLYDLTGLSQAIQRELQNAGAKIDPAPSISLSPDSATQKVELILQYLGSEVDFTQPQTFRVILGFDSQVIGPTVTAPLTILADNVASFNAVNFFLIHSDLVSRGIRFNNTYNRTISQVLIDVPPGSQIVASPFNPAKSDASDLAGSIRTNIRFYLTDDRNNAVNTSGEYWSCRIVVRYLIPHVIG